MAVKITNDLRATIRKSVASYNRKISYYNKKGIVNLPSKASVKAIINLGSRKAINRELKLMGGFGRKSVKGIIVDNELVPSYEREYFNERVKASKKALKNRIKAIGEMELKTAGKGAGFTYSDRFNLLYGSINKGLQNGKIRSDKLISNMRKYEKINTTSFKDYIKMSDSEKEAFMNLLARSENPYINPKLRDSFIESLNDLGYAYGIDPEKMAEIEKKLKGLSPEEFDKIFSQDLAMQKMFDYYYIMKMQLGANAFDNQEEVRDLFDTLYDNIDEIVSL